MNKESILKDTLAQLDAEEIVPVQGVYIVTRSIDILRDLHNYMGGSAPKSFRSEDDKMLDIIGDGRCATCVVGGMFLSYLKGSGYRIRSLSYLSNNNLFYGENYEEYVKENF